MGRNVNVSPVPAKASHPVNCNKSNTGKHTPTTKEGVYRGDHIKFSVCTSCSGSLS